MGGHDPVISKGMEAALESVMKTLRISDDRTKYTTWLACLTSDQKAKGFDGIPCREFSKKDAMGWGTPSSHPNF